MRLALPILLLAVLLGLNQAGQEKGGPQKEFQRVRLATIDGRYWLVGPNGKPFFGHGITHVSTRRAKPPINMSKFSRLLYGTVLPLGISGTDPFSNSSARCCATTCMTMLK